VVIVTRDVCGLLRRCLESVQANRPPFPVEVFVVDTGSSDGTASLVRQEFPEVTLLFELEDRGYAAANNLALRRAAGRYLLLLNPDTVLPPDCFAQAVRFMEEHPAVGALGPKLVKADGTLDLACRRSFPTPLNSLYHFLGLARRFPHSPRFGAYNLTYLDPDQEYPVDAVAGAFMLLRRRALEEVGLLDERYWMYGEDIDLAYRLRQGGWRTMYSPRVQVLHLKGQSSRQRPLRCTYEFFRAMALFYIRHYAPRRPWAVTLAVELAIMGLGAARLLRTALELLRRSNRTADEPL